MNNGYNSVYVQRLQYSTQRNENFFLLNRIFIFVETFNLIMNEYINETTQTSTQSVQESEHGGVGVLLNNSNNNSLAASPPPVADTNQTRNQSISNTSKGVGTGIKHQNVGGLTLGKPTPPLQSGNLPTDLNYQTESISDGKIPNNTGIPNAIKAGAENLSGLDLSAVKVHYNSDKPQQFGAYAFALGTDIHISSGNEDLLPHELWHVVQQLNNKVSATEQINNTPINKDMSLEKEAIQMGKKIITISKQDLLHIPQAPLQQKKISSSGVLQQAAVQSHYGTFEDKQYEFDNKNPSAVSSLKMLLSFTPNENVTDAKRIAFVQTVEKRVKGKPEPISPISENNMTADGVSIDRKPQYNNPIYGVANLAENDNLANSKERNGSNHNLSIQPNNANGTYQMGWRCMHNNNLSTSPAMMYDAPTVYTTPNTSAIFESSVLATMGDMQDTYLGSVQWGWRRDNKGVLSKYPLKKISDGTPSKKFLEAANAWNASRAAGSVISIEDNTQFYKEKNKAFVPTLKLPAFTEFQYTNTAPIMFNNKMYASVEIIQLDSQYKGQKGFVLVDDVIDKGNGLETIDLPINEVYRVNIATDLQNQEGKILALPLNTRVEILNTIDEDNVQIKIIDGEYTSQTGVIMSKLLTKE